MHQDAIEMAKELVPFFPGPEIVLKSDFQFTQLIRTGFSRFQAASEIAIELDEICIQVLSDQCNMLVQYLAF